MVAATLRWMRRLGRTKIRVLVRISGEGIRAVTPVFRISTPMGRCRGKIERRFRHEMSGVQNRSLLEGKEEEEDKRKIATVTTMPTNSA